MLAPGQGGDVPPTRNSIDQIALYDRLTPLGDRVRDADLPRFFKRASLGLAPGETATRIERPRNGVSIRRDRWGVPHIEGRTALDVAFGAGWATAADRRPLMELLRGPGRIAALDVPGIDLLSLAFSGRTFRPSTQAEAALARQYELLRGQGERGRLGIRVVDAYVAGVNAYSRRAGLRFAPWTRNDVVAVSALVGALFGSGGGDEVRRSQFLDQLQGRLGGERGRQVWEDLRQRDDPEARVAVPGRSGRSRFANELGNVVVDAGSLVRDNAVAAPTGLRMSNALLVGAKRSVSGKPLLVARLTGRAVLSAAAARARSLGRRLPHARGGVPGNLVRRALRQGHRPCVERDLGRVGSRRRVRRDPLRRQRHDVPLPRRVPGDDDARRRSARGSAGRGGRAARPPPDRARPGQGVRDGRGETGRDLVETLDARSRARVARILAGPLDEPRALGEGFLPRCGTGGACVQLVLRRQPGHRAVHERTAADAFGVGRSRAADEGNRGVRVARVSCTERARAVDQPTGRRDPQLEQQAGEGVRRGRRRVDVGLGAARGSALGRHPAAPAAHVGQRRRRR